MSSSLPPPPNPSINGRNRAKLSCIIFTCLKVSRAADCKEGRDSMGEWRWDGGAREREGKGKEGKEAPVCESDSQGVTGWYI